MCGIAGILDVGVVGQSLAETALSMSKRLAHRGPDDYGVWVDTAAGVALAHRRLSIIDVTEGGHQPMTSASGRYTICYNGEIYNFRELKKSLQKHGISFRSHSDTEVLLAAVDTWGALAAIRQLVGMFAFALWDGLERRLLLARDRAGEKPLYYGHIGDKFGFASELKAFCAIPGFNNRVDRMALSGYLRLACVPTPYSIYESIRKLPPGHCATVHLHRGQRWLADVYEYWSLADHVAVRSESYEESRDGAERLLSQSVRDQMVADVPLGAFLSGGIDSTAIVALMQENSARKVRTFSIGWTEPAYDEARHAAAVAQHLGTDHTELYVSPADALAVVPELGRIYDEPFADSSQIPTLLVARLARQHVAVALSGDAGDEVFGGYNRYTFAPRVWSAVGRLPVGVRSFLAAGIRSIPPDWWDLLGDGISRMGGRDGIRLLGEKMHKLARAIPAASHADLYGRLASCWLVSPAVAACPHPLIEWYRVPEALRPVDKFVEYMMLLDFVAYMTDDILVKVDRATMSASLEARVPMLDHRLVEFMGGVPVRHKVSESGSKRILRDIVHARVPTELIDRPKTGFGVPIDSWLRGPLRDWAESLLSDNSLKRHGLLDVPRVRGAWSEHQSGRSPRHHELWAVLMFQAWMEEYRAVA